MATTAIIGAAVAAAAAAASAAQQQAAQARARRQAAQNAQQAKQDMPGNAGGGGSVSESLLGGLSQTLGSPRIQSLFKPTPESKGVAGGVDASLPEVQPSMRLEDTSQPNMQPTTGMAQPNMGMDMQTAMGGQQPDYLKLLQMQQGGYQRF